MVVCARACVRVRLCHMIYYDVSIQDHMIIYIYIYMFACVCMSHDTHMMCIQQTSYGLAAKYLHTFSVVKRMQSRDRLLGHVITCHVITCVQRCKANAIT
jgi:hypothetical protein